MTPVRKLKPVEANEGSTFPSKLRTVTISAVCCHKGCKRVSRYAEKLSDFWVTFCDDHMGRKISLDMDKIPAATECKKRVIQ